MASLAIQYRAPSSLAQDGSKLTLALSATLQGRNEPFFQGQVHQPRLTARTLSCLSRIVGERWFDAAAVAEARRRMMDPLVTSGDGILRFEGFSGCRSLYARIDLLPEAVDIVSQSSGTTNVDFNQPLRAALARVRDQDSLSMMVDENAFTLIHGEDSLVEHKVELPLSWLKGLASIPSIASRSETIIELTGASILRLFNQLPRNGQGRDTHWLHYGGSGIRVSRTSSGDAIQVTGAKRLIALHDLIPSAQRLSIATTPEGNISLWTLHFDEFRFTLALSPEVWRGFSGEGSALTDLGKQPDPDLEQALLEQFDAGFDADEAAIRLGVTLPQVRRALAALASQGQVGYDHHSKLWFKRCLPGNDALIHQSNPRLAQAESWIEKGAVIVENPDPGKLRGKVHVSAAVAHHVAIDSGNARCTCFWFSKFENSRGPCSHILALQLAANRRI
jgi:hypothetical protein